MSGTVARLGIDIGGTFTDAAAMGPDGVIRIGKQLTSVGDEHEAVMAAATASTVPIDTPELILAHGTTLVINALLERRGARVALVTTEGFADVHEMGRGNRPEVFNPRYRRNPPLVPAERRFEIAERVASSGEILREPDDRELDRLVDELRAVEPEAIAVALINSYANPANERRVADHVAGAFPGVPVTVSSDISRLPREFERTTTAAANASVAPIIERYLDRLRQGLERQGFQGDFVVLDSNGGALTLELARRYPIRIVESGPVAGVIAARELAGELGLDNVVTFDMGGTTAKSSIVEGGRYPSTDLYWIAGYDRGFPLQVPSVDIIEVGAGGGSIAWVNDAGQLRVGPQSAGAAPGPACYGLGGVEPTVTDANLYCGRLPQRQLAGSLKLDRPAAAAAIERVARQLDIAPIRLALGIIELANLSMSSVVRRQTLEHGHDPREFTLIASGGAGPMHACDVAREVGITDVLVPPYPGHFSATGMLRANLRFERAESLRTTVDDLDEARLAASIERVAAEVRGLLEDAGVAADDEIDLEWSLALRYVGQEHTLVIRAPRGGIEVPAGTRDDLLRAFEAEYLRRYGHIDHLSRVEAGELQVVGQRRLPAPPATARETAEGAPATMAETWFLGEEAPRTTPVFDRVTLAEGEPLVGPAVICEEGATTLVPPGAQLTVLADGSMLIRLGERRDSERPQRSTEAVAP